MSNNPFPHPKGMTSFWQSEPGKFDNWRSSELLPAEVDIVIIGGGYSGAAIATHILADSASRDKSVLVLEARGLCSGATGRNGGHLKPDAYNVAAKLADTHGTSAAAELADFEAANVRAVADYVREEKVDCDFVVTRAIDVQFSSSHNDQLKGGYDKLVAAGVESTKDTFYVPRKHAETVSGVNGAEGVFTYTAGHMWPYKLIHHMISKAIRKGVNFHTHTPVIGLSSEPDSRGYLHVQTPRGKVLARTVIVAANAYTASILPEYAGKIVPYRAICARIVTPPSKKRPLLNNTYALRSSPWDFDYLIPRPDGSIIVGGARSAYLRNTDEWHSNTDDSKVIERARGYFDGYMQRHFHGWRDSEAYTDRVWTGIMGYSDDGFAHIGPVPGRPGVFIFGGFTGHGMPQIFLASKGLASMVLRGTPFEQTKIPRVFQETVSRLRGSGTFVEDIYAHSRQQAKL